MKNTRLKNVIKKKLDKWLDKVEINEDEGEGFLVYPTKDRFLVVVHLKDLSYREDREKTPKDVIGR